MIIGRLITAGVAIHNAKKTGIHGIGVQYVAKTPLAAQTLPLSSLVIDADKDWQGKSITNFKQLDLIHCGGIRLEDTLADDLCWSGLIFIGTAGVNLAQFQTVYRKDDEKYWLAKADSATTMPVIAIAVEAILANETGKFLLLGWIRNDAWALTAGQIAYQSAATAGLVTTTPPAASGYPIQRVGIALTDKIAHFNSIYVLGAYPQNMTDEWLKLVMVYGI